MANSRFDRDPVHDATPFTTDDRRFMALALDAARAAAAQGEVPVGAAMVLNGELLAVAGNASIGRSDPTAHAEVLALREAAARVGNYRIAGTTLYTTVEPCVMCLGAMLHARVERLVYGAADPKAGAVDRLVALREQGSEFNHRFETVGGLEADQAARLLLDFFRARREAADRSRRSTTVCATDGEVPKWS